MLTRVNVLGIVVVACALMVAVGASGRPATGAPTALDCRPKSLPLVSKGRLVVGTDPQTQPPWWGGTPRSPWEKGYPPSGLGYESAVAYAVAKRLGFGRRAVTWMPVTVSKALARGKKPFDLYLAQVARSPARAKRVTFSDSYYEIDQAVIGLEARPITNARTVRDLRSFKLGAPKGASYAYVVGNVKPTTPPLAYDTLAYAVAGLRNGEIDGLVVDFPTASSITGAPRSHSILVGRLAVAAKANPSFGLVAQRQNALMGCVNRALSALRKNGTLARLEDQWLGGSAPLFE